MRMREGRGITRREIIKMRMREGRWILKRDDEDERKGTGLG